MRILVAEDDKNKIAHVSRHVSGVCNDNGIDVEVVTATSYRSCILACVQRIPDVLILDMTMPTFDVALDEPGGRPRHFAGRDILRELHRRSIIIPTIVFTGFDVIGEGDEQCTRAELTGQLKELFPSAFRGTVFYSTSESGWKNEMTALLLPLL
ncbi:MAG: response regulator [Planctomycetota bacterium]